MLGSAVITSKGQITIPKTVRNILGLQKSDVIVFEKDEEKVFISTAKTLRDYRGILKAEGKTSDTEQMRAEAKRYVGQRSARLVGKSE